MKNFSEASNQHDVILLGLQPLVEATADALFSAVKNQLTESGLDLKNCIGYASDGAGVMVGARNSLWTRISEESPNCQQLKCICHSLALCTKYEFEKLPANIGFMVKEIPKWFRKRLRRDSFQQIFAVMNPEGVKIEN